jgi:three-Cys-motif partner protein
MTRSTIQKFGSAHTEHKLAKLSSYLESYTKVMKNQRFHTIYFDAFAGTGGVEIRGDSMPLFDIFESRKFIEGSTRLALQLKNTFDEYVFVELERSKAAELKEMIAAEFPHLLEKVSVVVEDCNVVLEEFCKSRNWHGQNGKQTRAVVFLDPKGNSVSWKSLEFIAATKAIDLWYLFPAGWGVNRQIAGDGTIHFTHEASITRLYGSDDWKKVVATKMPQLSLPGIETPSTIKTATPTSMTQYMMTCMREIFEGGVCEEWLPLGENGRHDFSLIFG